MALIVVRTGSSRVLVCGRFVVSGGSVSQLRSVIFCLARPVHYAYRVRFTTACVVTSSWGTGAGAVESDARHGHA